MPGSRSLLGELSIPGARALGEGVCPGGMGMSRSGYLQGLGIPEGEGWAYQREGAGHSRGGGIPEGDGYTRGWGREGVGAYGHPFRHGTWNTLFPSTDT